MVSTNEMSFGSAVLGVVGFSGYWAPNIAITMSLMLSENLDVYAATGGLKSGVGCCSFCVLSCARWAGIADSSSVLAMLRRGGCTEVFVSI